MIFKTHYFFYTRVLGLRILTRVLLEYSSTNTTRFRLEMGNYRNLANKELSIGVIKELSNWRVINRDLLGQRTFNALNNLFII
jgi:hypothetical protein